MATKADFTEQEWDTLEKGVTGAGFWMTVSDRGFFDTFKEAGALTRHLTEARQSSSSELIRELAETRSTGFGLTSSSDENASSCAAQADSVDAANASEQAPKRRDE